MLQEPFRCRTLWACTYRSAKWVGMKWQKESGGGSVRQKSALHRICRCGQARSVELKRVQAISAHVDHTVDALKVAFHFQQWGCVQEQAVTFKKRRGEHDVGKPSFIFQSKKAKPFGCTWALAHDDVTRHFHPLPMGTLGQSTGR